MQERSFSRAYRIGVAGPVGSGKTALVDCLSQKLWPAYNLAVITNDIYTKEDAEFLMRQGTLPAERIRGVETGGCPHAAIREDASMNLEAIADLEDSLPGLELIFVESGGDNLAAAFSPELVDTFIYVIDVAEGEKIPRKGGPGITRSDLLVINKIDLAAAVGASLDVMTRDSRRMRGERPFILTNLKNGTGLNAIIDWIEQQITTDPQQRRVILDAHTPIPRRPHQHGPVSSPLLPPRYQNGQAVSSAAMGSAALQYTDNGQVAWDQMWTAFCDLALAGGPPHRGTLLEPVTPAEVATNPEAYERVLAEIERGWHLVTKLKTVRCTTPGWIGLLCHSEEMALWLLQAILVENVCVRREGTILYFPAGPDFRLEDEIKNLVTVVAKTYHYWQEHYESLS